jgi:hypothetical protein
MSNLLSTIDSPKFRLDILNLKEIPKFVKHHPQTSRAHVHAFPCDGIGLKYLSNKLLQFQNQTK